MKKSLRTVLASLLALCFMFAFAASAGAAEAVDAWVSSFDNGDFGDIVEYDYINKTERIISQDEIFDYASVTRTTYELDGMESELDRLAEMNASMSIGVDGGASTLGIIDSKKPFERTPPKTNNVPATPYSGVVYLILGIDLDKDGSTDTLEASATGFLVGPDVLVTAGHNIINLDTPIVELRVYPYIHQASGFNPDVNENFIYPSYWYYSEHYKVCLQQDLVEEANHDWAVLKLQSSIPDAYNFECSYNISDLSKKDICVSGYPYCSDATCPFEQACPIHHTFYQVTSTGRMNNYDTYRVWYTNNVKGGSSGSPVYLPSTRVCYAIHAKSYGDADTSTLSKKYNSGTRISQNIYNLICTEINK